MSSSFVGTFWFHINTVLLGIVIFDQSLAEFYCTKISDINECSVRKGECQQNCKNLPGSYECSCDEGYRLRGDLKTCEGMDCGLTDKLDDTHFRKLNFNKIFKSIKNVKFLGIT